MLTTTKQIRSCLAANTGKSLEGRPMLSGPVIITVALLYLCLLFAIAYYGDKRADQGRSLIANPTIYALSIAVYCTSWTFYGSVGRAASSGIGFLPIYLRSEERRVGKEWRGRGAPERVEESRGR